MAVGFVDVLIILVFWMSTNGKQTKWLPWVRWLKFIIIKTRCVMDEQAKIAFERELAQKADALKKVMLKGFASNNVCSRVEVSSGMGKPIAVIDIVDPDKLGEDLDMSNATATERMAMVYDITVSAIVMYSDLSPTEARIMAQMCQNQFERRGVFNGLSESVEE
jgi:hypothetical protein